MNTVERNECARAWDLARLCGVSITISRRLSGELYITHSVLRSPLDIMRCEPDGTVHYFATEVKRLRRSLRSAA
jgi:hypothetical protein